MGCVGQSSENVRPDRSERDHVGTSAARALTQQPSPSPRPAEALANIKPASEIIREHEINAVIDRTKEAAKDPARVREILELAHSRALLKHVPDGAGIGSEYVQVRLQPVRAHDDTVYDPLTTLDVHDSLP